jgi:hypothetical protein
VRALRGYQPGQAAVNEPLTAFVLIYEWEGNRISEFDDLAELRLAKEIQGFSLFHESISS